MRQSGPFGTDAFLRARLIKGAYRMKKGNIYLIFHAENPYPRTSNRPLGVSIMNAGGLNG